ncbi:MAG: PAS domain S-box protein [Thermoanaerobaculia bacterium]|nr:PAS domain S-box protein [Thermoanaerobaculia bacterium]
MLDHSDDVEVDWLSRCTSILGVGTAIWDHRGHLTQISPTLERMASPWGTAEGWWAVLVAEVGPAQLVSRLGAGAEIAVRLDTPDGQRRSFRLTASGYVGSRAESGPDSTGTDMVLLVSDTTLSERTLQALRDSETRYSSLFQGSSDGILVHDLDGRILEANPKAVEMLGYSEDALRGKLVMDLHPSSALAGAKQAIQRISQEPSIRFEIDFVREDGITFPAEVSASLLGVGDRELVQATVRDITERKRAEEILRQSEERKSAMLETALDCIVTIDHRGKILEFNPAAEVTFGYRRDEAIGRSMAELLLPEEYRQAHEEGMARYLATGEARVLGQRLELPALRSDGQVLLMEVAITRLPTSSGEAIFAGYLRDITARKQAEERMSQALGNAREANRAKSDFLASMSHELRTPLNVICGMTELARDEQDEADIGPYLDAISSSADSLLNLIDDLLDISRIEAGRFEIDPRPLIFRRLIEDMSVPFELRADQKGLSFLWQVDESVPVALLLDGPRLKQVLLNLLSNAVKFTDEGTVALKASAKSLGGNRHRLTVVVEDTGIGFDPAMAPRIFERFEQLRRPGGGRPEGTGLGLAISRALAELMGGELQADSAPGEGSSFRLQLDVEEVPRWDEKADEERSAAPDSEGTGSILLVDDHAGNRVVAVRFLEKAGYRVTEAASGEEALEILDGEDDSFDLILMDIEMVGLDGFETTSRIRQMPNREDVPVVALTAHASKGFQEICLAAGMDDYVSKPIDRRHLLTMVSRFVTGDTGSDSPIRPGVRARDDSVPGVPREGPIFRTVKAEIGDLIPGFLLRCREASDRLSETLDPDDAKRIGHNLKGSGSAYGFPEISEIGRVVEQRALRGESWNDLAGQLTDFLDRLHLK